MQTYGKSENLIGKIKFSADTDSLVPLFIYFIITLKDSR